MGMIIDMLDAVTIIPVAAATIPEFQFRMFGISPAADGAFVTVGPFSVLAAVTVRPVGGRRGTASPGL